MNMTSSNNSTIMGVRPQESNVAHILPLNEVTFGMQAS